MTAGDLVFRDLRGQDLQVLYRFAHVLLDLEVVVSQTIVLREIFYGLRRALQAALILLLARIIFSYDAVRDGYLGNGIAFRKAG